EDDWDYFMGAVFESASRNSESPTDALYRWVSCLQKKEKPEDCPWDTDDRRTSLIVNWLPLSALDELRLWRTPDSIVVSLYRQDGSVVGELDGPELSVGQRCTAVLALLLVQDSTPIIIDQPEEDLDNEFVYRELVPLIRGIKERRQIIVISHNANIPVNGDAELIVALQVRNQRGHQMEIGGRPSVGSLDCHGVKLAVEEIMEGTEEAFRRRYEKYGF
ncbi:MAG: ABC transporter ATP-binding protein, partial [Pseudomonadota bacterium]